MLLVFIPITMLLRMRDRKKSMADMYDQIRCEQMQMSSSMTAKYGSFAIITLLIPQFIDQSIDQAYLAKSTNPDMRQQNP